jgi:periplasmic divalent cation tolerance protein
MSRYSSKTSRNTVLLVLVSCPGDFAEQLAGELVESRLASCINILAGVKSLYRWKGKVERDTESLMLIKCTADNYPGLEARILDSHPYELPEIVTVSELGGLKEYLQWVVNPDKPKEPNDDD